MTLVWIPLLDPFVHSVMHIARAVHFCWETLMTESVTRAIRASDDRDGDRLSTLEFVKESLEAVVGA